MTRSKIEFKSDPTTINFNNIDVHDVKHLPSSFDGDILFVLPPMAMGVPNAYGGITSCATDTLDAQQKTTNIHTALGFSFRHSSHVGNF